jgi:glycosyltransferase involved in cell wall biosynthesis
MISIIICSARKGLLQAVNKNIEETIGIPYETIVINNQDSKYGICEAYNIGAAQSNKEFLCFIHEDMLFHTQNWGSFLIEHLKDQSTGVVGVAGGLVKSSFHSSWWYNLPEINTQRKNLIQKSKEGNKHDYQNPENEHISDVLFIDGFFIACRKEVWKMNPFDSVHFPKFHFYDLDFSYQIRQTYRVVVVYDILIEHNSTGSYNKDWVIAAEKFSKKWQSHFPVSLINLTEREKTKIEREALRFYRDVCLKRKLFGRAIKAIICLLKLSPMDKQKNL